MRNLFLIIVLSIMLYSCEEIVENPSLPYKEQLVIRAVLESGKPVSGVRISRTLPPLEEYDSEKALIQDADVNIESNGKIYKLDFDNHSGTYYCDELIPAIGMKYALKVTRGNLHASAVTTIPDNVNIESFLLKIKKADNNYSEMYWDFIIESVFKPKTGAVYTGYFFSYDDNGNHYVDFAYKTSDTLKNGRLFYPISSFGYDSNLDSTLFKENINNYDNKCRIDSWDAPFYDYFITRYQGNSDDDIFGTSGINIKGNIVGGIGVFIGKTSTVKKIFIE